MRVVTGEIIQKNTAECPSRKGGGQILWNVGVGEYRIDANVYVAETGETATATRRIVVI